MVAITTLVGIGCYAASAHGAGQRDDIQSMRRQLVSDVRAIRDLEAELRTRARLPQLERWNEDVLKMSAPAAGQFMRSPVQLASLMTPKAPADSGPRVQYAVATEAPVEALTDTTTPKLLLAGFTAATPSAPAAGEP